MARHWSWASCEFSIIKEGKPATIHTFINSISYSDGLETALVQGAGRDPLGTTDPVYVPEEMSFDMFAKWFRTWAADVTNNGESRLGDHEFRMVLKRKSLSETETVVDTIDFVVKHAEDSGSGGAADPLMTSVSCLTTKILRNNVQL